MKTTSNILALLFLLGCSTVFSQTEIIAHKSHSGKMGTFSIFAPNDGSRFGLPPMFMDSIKRISDSTVVEFARQGGFFIDTVTHHQYCSDPNISLDSLRKLYPSDTRFIGFEEAKKDSAALKPSQADGIKNKEDK